MGNTLFLNPLLGGGRQDGHGGQPSQLAALTAALLTLGEAGAGKGLLQLAFPTDTGAAHEPAQERRELPRTAAPTDGLQPCLLPAP